ncbi:hypothetical protein BT63DRAFT_246031 [Microthyrium microscopicum]|uniref:F-box domain-containing protein n=1 Tax=Microthyrium microscopicum TaxID=703497 RepID=A0A6A6UBU1_9PEZI|nr:hypothetical protein BT63DRAFT_246031 [Microthyrium microscopicum]
MMSFTVGLLSLPDELIIIILKYSQHQSCIRFWRASPHSGFRGAYSNAFLSNHYSLEVFSQALKAPSKLRKWLYRYVNAIKVENVERDYGQRDRNIKSSDMSDVLTQWPWLKTEMLHFITEYSKPQERLPKPRVIQYLRAILDSRVYQMPDKINKWDWISVNELFSFFTLLSLPNLEEIVFVQWNCYYPKPYSTCVQAFLGLLGLDGGCITFAKIKRLKILQGGSIPMDTVGTLIKLPALEILKVDGLFCHRDSTSKLLWPLDDTIYSGTVAGSKNANLKQLVLRKSCVNPNELHKLMNRLPSLQSLVLEFPRDIKPTDCLRGKSHKTPENKKKLLDWQDSRRGGRITYIPYDILYPDSFSFELRL